MTATAMPDFLVRAAECVPELKHATVPPVAEVRVVSDLAAFQGLRMERVTSGAAHEQRALGAGDAFILDFGVHLVGRLCLRLTPSPAADAPTRLRLVFAETPAELAEEVPPERFGSLSRSWFQDEVVNVDVLPQSLCLPRRYAFRYLKIEVVDTSPAYRVQISGLVCETASSADISSVAPLPGSVPADLRQIDEVSLRTLANCMQTVFEDGPKRDRRLWLGDLRLQAMANYASFRNMELVKRCLYLFAALPREDGLVNADIYEYPEPRRGNCSILDYSALFAPTVLDYLQASGDRETAETLWPTAKKQLDLLKYLDRDGLFHDPGNWWLFIDWQPRLHKSAAVHGVLLYGARATLKLAQLLGRESEVVGLERQIEHMRGAALDRLFDDELGLFVSGEERQVSWASQAWLILADVVGGEEAAAILKRLMQHPGAVAPAGPYLYHHVLDAMLLAGLKKEAAALLRDYWGGMIQRGATTFWEVFDPRDDKLSPYKSHLINSYCHAWSCTPAYFIRSREVRG